MRACKLNSSRCDRICSPVFSWERFWRKRRPLLSGGYYQKSRQEWRIRPVSHFPSAAPRLIFASAAVDNWDLEKLWQKAIVTLSSVWWQGIWSHVLAEEWMRRWWDRKHQPSSNPLVVQSGTTGNLWNDKKFTFILLLIIIIIKSFQMSKESNVCNWQKVKNIKMNTTPLINKLQEMRNQSVFVSYGSIIFKSIIPSTSRKPEQTWDDSSRHETV